MNEPRADARDVDKEIVGPYRVQRAIGAGGSARIDLAVIERAYGFQRQVVLKRPLEHLRDDAHVASTLRREAELGGRLRHPNLVAVLDAGTHAGYDYLALEYVEGASLREVMRTSDPAGVHALPVSAALSIVVSVARGLHEAHELTRPDGAPLGLVHRDVSPGNILLDRDGAVKLADFGIAKETRVATLSGSMRGTVTYMAPEQCRGHAFDRRADVFSLGVILYELITARRLFWADNDVASLHKVLSAPIADPREIDPSLPAELAAIASRAIHRDTTERLASAKELADRIEAFAARAGIVLGARTVARLGPGTRGPIAPTAMITVPISIPVPDDVRSLVTVIEGNPDGPYAEAHDDEVATPVRRPTYSDAQPYPQPAPPPAPVRRASWLPATILGAAIGSAVATFLFLQRDPPAPARAPISSPAVDAAAATVEAEPAPPPVVAPDAAIEEAIDEAIELSPDAADAPETPRLRRPVRPAPAEPKVEDASTVPPDAAPPDAAPAARPNSEWNPRILLPTDPGSATTKP